MRFYLKTTKLIRAFHSRKLIWDFAAEDKTLYLTFDDGPCPGVTERVLEILDKYQAKATFFCLGEKVRLHPQLFETIKTKGHAVGNHTYNHKNGWKVSTKDFIRSVKQAEQYIKSDLFRPPYGKIRTPQLKLLKKDYKIIMWSVLSGDFDENIPKEECWQNVMNNAYPGSIIVFHDSYKASVNMLYALEMCLEHFSKNGYDFKAITI